MNSQGVIGKRCGCVDTATGRRRGSSCPRLPEREHGSWYFHCSTRNLIGQAERIRRGGFSSQAAARRARDELLALSREGQAGRSWTVTRWLRYWLSTRTRIRPTTRMHYTRDIEQFLIPHLGQLILGDVTSRQLNAAFAAIAATRTRAGQLRSACTLQHLHTTLRAALTGAVREGLIRDNPARRVELPARPRPQAQVWTEARVAQWQASGERPTIAVWTPTQLASFLDYVRDDSLFAFWWLVALRGLRRGEAAGLRWTEVDLRTGQLSVVRQRTTAGYDVHEGPPKSQASRRTVALDQHTVRVLRQHRERQRQRRAARIDVGKMGHDSGYVFTGPDGLPIRPGYLTQRLRLLVGRAGLPPIRLHDLRHGAATLAHAAGADLKTVQDQLGHATIHLTADTYTSVLPDTQRQAAEATVRLVLDAATPGDEIRRQIEHNRTPPQDPTAEEQAPSARGCWPRWKPSRPTGESGRRTSKRRLGRVRKPL
ncbi:tyrosine-type recombinase/integrase [Micromonospora sp. WMMD961]|uniref:tyrosine-type recombinase/integrase n=1 Tax=Micromonospora sp. WMMD961 TaxID=3016100 RepID=UPI0024179052|nr:tyrosine-type recombinase/integrase [Micromonospora sp. WMMD961]MDG4778159.1 tyrosine-type recombinase/integrase [Micromonospora sp. WMMD961]